MSQLEARKQLLIAESEVNRIRLLQDWGTLADGVGSFAGRAGSINTLTRVIMSLVGGLANYTNGRSEPVSTKSSWLQKIASGARLVSTIWLAFRSRKSDPEKSSRDSQVMSDE